MPTSSRKTKQHRREKKGKKWKTRPRENQKEEPEWPSYVSLKGQNTPLSTKKNTTRDIQMDISLSAPGGEVLLTDATFKVMSGTKYGVVGRNGVGKSMLMSCLARREEPFHNIPEHIRILHLEEEVEGDERTPLETVLQSNPEREWLLQQEQLFLCAEEEDDDLQEKMSAKSYDLNDIHDRLREVDSDKAEARAGRILFGLGFQNDQVRRKKTREYSGGWRMRLALACALFGEPDLLILDEPTNHLDMNAVVWLEDYLSRWEKSLLLVCHDEEFLNGVVDVIIHVDNQTLTYYKGDYNIFAKVRRSKRREVSNRRRAQLTEKKRLERYVSGRDEKQAGLVERGARENLNERGIREANLAKERKKLRAHRLWEEERGVEEEGEGEGSFVFPPMDMKEELAVISVKEVSFAYPSSSSFSSTSSPSSSSLSPLENGKEDTDKEELLFQDLDLAVYLDSRIGCVGPNGVGKSTLLKILNGELQPTQGVVERKKHLRIARFHQHVVERLDPEVSPLGYLAALHPRLPLEELSECLRSFGVGEGVVEREIGGLSGGQQSLVALAEMALCRPHVLLLDEPTNHLDMETIELLVEGLKRFEGAVVVISHNQHFVESVVTELWVVGGGDRGVERVRGEFREFKERIIQQLHVDLGRCEWVIR